MTMACEAEFAALQAANQAYVAAKAVCDQREAEREAAYDRAYDHQPLNDDRGI